MHLRKHKRSWEYCTRLSQLSLLLRSRFDSVILTQKRHVSSDDRTMRNFLQTHLWSKNRTSIKVSTSLSAACAITVCLP
ncbi:hypothetical protein OESDEN_20260 [Oesophagostomum dentatum]|uniref:Uncharacterized protein n=1 Tax=Oesophagostomum dentatum TaxID=61180 RepID=A0A0B1S575_OESDE|nr:hypothetical protein OESDEN_20260 [Oesophagostomum dentatum]